MSGLPGDRGRGGDPGGRPGRDPRLGAWVTLGEPRFTRELMASGLGWVGLDQQHGHVDDRALRAVLELRPVAGTPVLVRVAANSAALIGRALDAGADGVIVPLVSSVEDARAAVDAGRYPPHGSRSWGPLPGSGTAPRPGEDAGPRPVPLCSVMIETAAALQAVEQIAAVPGVDMIFVGPVDLSLALGLDLDELLHRAEDDAPLRRIARACAAAGTRAGAYAGTPERAALLAAAGFTWLAATTDAALVTLGVSAARRSLAQSDQDARSPGNASS